MSSKDKDCNCKDSHDHGASGCDDCKKSQKKCGGCGKTDINANAADKPVLFSAQLTQDSPSEAVRQTMANNPPTNRAGWQNDAAKAVTDPRLRTLPKPPGKAMSFASNTVAGAPSIVEMARALKGTASGSTAVGQIFQFVYDNIEWEPGWGVQKGALGCLIAGSGNQFDQSLLLANLLRQAGFTSNIVMGSIRLLEADYMAWWDVNAIWAAQNYCFNLFIPVVTAPTWNGSTFYMDIRHVWVEVVISGTTYVLDPSRKTYTRKTPMSSSSLASAMGYSQSTFLSNAQSGATVDGSGNWVQNMNVKNINDDLKTYTANLVSYIKSNTIGSAGPGTASVDDILGGQSIVPVTLPLTLSTSLSYQMPGDTPTTWTGDVSSSFKPTLQVQFPNWSNPNVWDFTYQTTSDNLAGKRLTLFYDGSLVPSLYLDGSSVATGLAQPGGTWTSLYLTVTHPAYDASNYPLAAQQWYQTNWQWWQSFIYAGGGYMVANAWGSQSRANDDYHQKRLAAIKANTSATAEQRLGEAFAMLFAKWMSQATRTRDLANRFTRNESVVCHGVGIIASDDATSHISEDINGVAGSSTNLDNNMSQIAISDTVRDMHGVALEAAVLSQVTGKTPGTSTTTVVYNASRTAIATIGGTVTTSDVLTLTVNDAALAGGTKSKNYTVVGGDTLTTIATGLANAINGDTDLAGIGVTAQGIGPAVYMSSTSVNQTSYSSSLSGGATETISIAFEKIYKGTSGNWNTGINLQNTLVANGYNSGDMSNLYNWWIQWGNDLLIADHPNQKLDIWQGWGYWVIPSSGAIGIINGGFKGGKINCGLCFNGAQVFCCTYAPDDPGEEGGKDPKPGKTQTGQKKSDEPIGLFTGDFFYKHTDITLGSQAFPYGLSFERSYNSADQYVNTSSFARGWTHNLAMSAKFGNDGLLCMGDHFAVQGASTIVEFFVLSDLFADTSHPITKLVTASLASKWWIDQIVNSTVVLKSADGVKVFVKQPDGSYTPPAEMPSSLALASGAYTLTTPQGDQWVFNTSGQISSIVYPAGVTVSFSYTSGKLTSVSNGMGRTLTLNYTSGVLTSVTDGNGRTISFTVDGNSNLTAVADTLNNSITYAYDQPGRMTQFFMPANPATAYCTNVYDSLSRVQTQTNARSQQWTYYFAGSRAEEIDPLNNSSVNYFNRLGSTTRSINALGQESKFEFDGLNRVVRATAPEGNYRQFAYDLNNNVLTITDVAKSGSGLSNIVQNFTYDSTWNKVHTAQDGRGNTTTYNWNATTGTLTNVQRPMVGGLTPQVSYAYTSRGQIDTVTDETGVISKFSYDATYEKLTSAVLDYGTSPHLNLTTAFGYDSVGNTTSVTDPNGNQLTASFDSERRLTQTTAPSPFSYQTKLFYDANSNVTKVQKQVTSEPAWQTTTFTYSVTDKKLTATNPVGKVSTWAFDGADRLQSFTDAQSRQFQYSYDALNRLYTVTDPTSTACDTMTYTANGLLYQRADARSKTTTYSYDGFDRLNKQTFADSSFEQNSSYDANGNVLTYVTRSGNTITMTWDVLNRLSTRTPQGQSTYTMTYDLAGRLTKANKPTVSGDPSTGDFQFAFDTAGRFYQEQYPDGKQVTHILDSNGNRTRTTWPDSYYITRVFDQLNRMTDIKLNGSGTSAAHFDYDQLSRRTKLTYSNGANVCYSWAPNNDLAALLHNYASNSVSFNMGYNHVGQLVGNNPSNGSYAWHPSGGSSVNYGTADNANKYPTVGGVSYSYDGNMNLTGDGVWTFGYNTENQLTSASKTGVSASYLYDPIGRQAQKTVGSTKTRFIYDGTALVADYDTSGNLVNRYVHGGIDEVMIQITAGGTVSFFHHDNQNSVVAVTDNAGAITNQYAYSPWGEITSLSGTPFGYTGQRYDAETGLHYYKARYLSNSLGRFLQCDPIGYAAGLNLVAYVDNDPLNVADSSGLVPDSSRVYSYNKKDDKEKTSKAEVRKDPTALFDPVKGPKIIQTQLYDRLARDMINAGIHTPELAAKLFAQSDQGRWPDGTFAPKKEGEGIPGAAFTAMVLEAARSLDYEVIAKQLQYIGRYYDGAIKIPETIKSILNIEAKGGLSARYDGSGQKQMDTDVGRLVPKGEAKNYDAQGVIIITIKQTFEKIGILLKP